MLLLKRLFASTPHAFKRRHDVSGLIATLGQRFSWIRRDAAQIWGQRQEAQVRAPQTVALNDSDSRVSPAVQDALDKLKATATPPNLPAV